MEQNRNFLMTIVLSVLVLILWQILYVNPRIEQQRKINEAKERIDTSRTQTPDSLVFSQDHLPKEPRSEKPELTRVNPHDLPSSAVVHTNPELPQASQSPEKTARIPFDTAALSGSINLLGARIDDLKLKKYRQTVEKNSPIISLLSPQSLPNAYFVEIGFLSSQDTGTLPGPETVWKAETSHALSSSYPVVLSFTNEKGLNFRRTISVDTHYMFTVSDTVSNSALHPLALSLYGRITRFNHMIPVSNYLLHEGLISVTGKEGLQEFSFSKVLENKEYTSGKSSDGWLGMTDKYWAVALIPAVGSVFQPRFSYFSDNKDRFQTDFITDPVTLAPAASITLKTMVFAGAKEVSTLYEYRDKLGIRQFELMIDWGWFYFITNPMFHFLDAFYKLLGNFGLSILATTVLVKIFFFPFANKSYRSMANMKKIQPRLVEIREKYKDERTKQHQAIMNLYKAEKINPVAGCWPILIQIPFFFALYKVLYVTIEMRHAPFFGWVHDLAAPDPLSVFNLFGLIHFQPPSFLMVGVWPLIMGLTMFIQMRMNPTSPDPVQASIFNWMPVLFTFMLAAFPSGLVIYWAWNNLLSILQQAVIMKYHGAKIELLDNMISMFAKKKG